MFALRIGPVTLALAVATSCAAVHDEPGDGAVDPTADAAGSACGSAIAASSEAMLPPPPAVNTGSFGWSLAMSADGTRVAVGAFGESPRLGTNMGAVHVFVRSGTTWSEEAVLRTTVASQFAEFGRSVAIDTSGSRIVVGATRDDPSGSARVFVRSGASWTEETTLAPEGLAAGAELGAAVALDHDATRALIGASADGGAAGAHTGSAHVFSRAGGTWIEEAALAPTTLVANDFFGSSVALSADGTRAIVGAAGGGPTTGFPTGSAYVFVRTGTTWTEEASLHPGSGPSPDSFGVSVALDADGTRAIVGANHQHTAGGPGNARVFMRSGTTWTEEALLPGTGSSSVDYFGTSVALSADATRAVVGAPLWSSGRTIPGGAHVYVRCGTRWSEAAVLFPAPSDIHSAELGWAVGMTADGSRVAAGAADGDVPGFGAVFVLAP